MSMDTADIKIFSLYWTLSRMKCSNETKIIFLVSAIIINNKIAVVCSINLIGIVIYFI